jgi:hypothetical protein
LNVAILAADRLAPQSQDVTIGSGPYWTSEKGLFLMPGRQVPLTETTVL